MGYFIKELTYEQLRPLITERSVVVLPIGGGAKEHGNHLPMGTDYFVTDWVANAVTARENVLTLPTLPYAYFPAFVHWEGFILWPSKRPSKGVQAPETNPKEEILW